MGKTRQTGEKEFETIQKEKNVYVDRTNFIRKWWYSNNPVMLVLCPEKFGKTLMLSTVETFFSLQYAGRSDLFKDFKVWKDKNLQSLQGTYPVIRFSFAEVEGKDYPSAVRQINQILTCLYSQYLFVLNGEGMSDKDETFFQSVSEEMNEETTTICLYQLSRYLCYYYRKKIMILFDEYDVPMQRADKYGYSKEMEFFMKMMINASFRTNPYLARAIFMGTAYAGKEAVFSDVKQLKIAEGRSKEYEEYFGCAE